MSSEPDIADELLAEFAQRLGRQGWRVCGLLQHSLRSSGTRKQMTLIDLNDPARRFPISQDLGAGSSACTLDPAGVAAAGVVLRDALGRKIDLAIANRFGILEASGKGLVEEMLALMGERTPLLTVVAERYLEAWRAFTGGQGIELPLRIEALEAWFTQCPGPVASRLAIPDGSLAAT